MSPEQFDAIIESIYAGQSADAAITAAGVSSGTFYRRISEDDELAGKYARACAGACHRLADGLVALSDRDDLAPDDKRVRIDARKWSLSKRLPKIYGDKLEHTGDVRVGLFGLLSGVANAAGSETDR